jgi:DNA-binding NarL/FixJ family response regulator
MIRIAVVDDHPALRAGLRTVLDTEPGIVHVGESAGDEESLWPMLNHTHPDLVMLDYHLPRGDGMQLCYRLKGEPTAPKVIVFSAYASPALALAARLAGADAMLAKAIDARELFESIRRVHHGEALLPPVPPRALSEASRNFDPAQQMIVAMLLDGERESDIAKTLRVDRADIRHAVQRALHHLRIDITPAHPG